VSLPVRDLDPDVASARVPDEALILAESAWLPDEALILAESAVPLVLVGHGSRDPRSSATVRALADRVARRWAGPVIAAFLDFDPPTVPGALRDLTVGGVTPGTGGTAGSACTGPTAGSAGAPVVVPALLTRAYHGRVDLPEVLGSVPMRTRLAAVLGPAAPDEPVDPLLVSALLRRVSEVEGGLDGLALLAAGTSHPAARSTVEHVAAALAGALDVPCAVGYASASTPDPAGAVQRLRSLGCRRVVGAAYFLAPGRLYDAAVAGAVSAGALAVAAPLGAAPELVELVLARAGAALHAG
jgi:sirohydrochlorin ferrochelatase